MKESKEKRKVTVAPVDEFPPGARVEINVGKIDIAVFNVRGEYFAIFGICPHQLAPLSRGRLQGTVVCNEHTNWEKEWAHDGEVIVCPGHAMEFDLRTGKAFGYGLKLRTYDVIVEDDWVKVIL